MTKTELKCKKCHMTLNKEYSEQVRQGAAQLCGFCDGSITELILAGKMPAPTFSSSEQVSKLSLCKRREVA